MSNQGEVYLTFVEGELKAERERRATFDSRGQALVATSGVLVAILSGITAAAEAGTKLHAPTLAVGVFLLALALFVLSAVLGIVAGWNHYYAVAKHETLERMLGDHWKDGEVNARNNVATVHARTIQELRASNQFKATCISYGLIFQVLALITFAGGVVLTLGQID